MSSNDDRDDSMIRGGNRRLWILGLCWIVFGMLSLIFGLWLISVTNTATVMFGALLNRVANPFVLMSDFHFLYSLTIIFSIVSGVIAVLAGLTLAAGSRLGRPLGLIASFLALSSIPLGTTLGIYSLIVLLQSPAASHLEAASETRSGNLRHQAATM